MRSRIPASQGGPNEFSVVLELSVILRGFVTNPMILIDQNGLGSPGSGRSPDEPYSLSQPTIEVRLDTSDHPGSVPTPSRSRGVLRGITSSRSVSRAKFLRYERSQTTRRRTHFS